MPNARHPAGSPAGGQFAPHARDEGTAIALPDHHHPRTTVPRPASPPADKPGDPDPGHAATDAPLDREAARQRLGEADDAVVLATRQQAVAALDLVRAETAQFPQDASRVLFDTEDESGFTYCGVVRLDGTEVDIPDHAQDAMFDAIARLRPSNQTAWETVTSEYDPRRGAGSLDLDAIRQHRYGQEPP